MVDDFMNDAVPIGKTHTAGGGTAPILGRKAHEEASVFQVENLLREGRRQRGRTDRPVPAVCVLDPDGDVVRYLRSTGNGEPMTGSRSESCPVPSVPRTRADRR